jgi:V/A-type H+-transporting ATPase subunit A
VTPFWEERVDPEFRARRDRAMAMLQRESELAEIVRLVGVEALSAEEQILMETSKSLREDFLQQNAFRDDDQFTSLEKQDRLLQTILLFYDTAVDAHGKGAPLHAIFESPVREHIARAKYLPEEGLSEFDQIAAEIETQLVADAIAGRKETEEQAAPEREAVGEVA